MDVLCNLLYLLNKAGYIGISKINGEFNIDFGGYCPQKSRDLNTCIVKCVEIVDNWKGY